MNVRRDLFLVAAFRFRFLDGYAFLPISRICWMPVA